MGIYNSAVITNTGQALLAQSVAGNDLKFTTVKTSNYTYPSGTSLADLTTLTGIKQSKNITGATVYNSRVIKVSAMVDNAGVAAEYSINTIGVYATIGTAAEQLFAVITAQEADKMPAFNSRPYSYIYDMNMTMQGTANITVTVNNAGFVNINDLNNALDGVNDSITDLDETVNDRIDTLSSSVDTRISALNDAIQSVADYFVLPENYNLLTDKTAESGKTFDASGNIITGNYMLFPMYIPVEPNTTYIGSGFNYYGSVRGYNASKVVISNGVTTNVKNITTGPNTYFVRISVNSNAVAEDVVFQKGTTASIPDAVRLSDDVEVSLAPFDVSGVSKKNREVTDAFSAFVIHLSDPSAEVKLIKAARNSGNPRVHSFVITVDGVQYSPLNIVSTGYTEKEYNAFILSDSIYGYFIVNWNALTTGTDYININASLKQGNILPLDARYDLSPFEISGLTGQKMDVVGAFSAFVVNVADPSADVKLVRVRRNSGSPVVHSITISVNGVQYNALNVLSANYTETAYNRFSVNAEIYGYYIIDWDALASGTYLDNINVPLKQSNVLPLDAENENIEIVIPDTINATVGHEISLEYYNIVRCSNINEYTVLASPNTAQIQNLHDRLRIVPTTAGTTAVTISIYKNDILIASKTFNVVIKADTQPTIKALFLGDSMTNQGYFLAELKNMLGSKLTLYGTRSTTAVDADNENITVLHEGRPGWSTSMYVNNASYSGVENPFYNSGFDFSYYMENHAEFNDVTDVFILLGTNDGYGTGFETRYQTICESIKAYRSGIRIHCMLPVPPIRSGYAYGIRNYMNYMIPKNQMLNLDKKILVLYGSTNGYSIIPTHANLNCYYDFPQTEVPANSRNPQLIPVGNDNVHPSKYGYYRFSDVIYADIIANCQ